MGNFQRFDFNTNDQWNRPMTDQEHAECPPFESMAELTEVMRDPMYAKSSLWRDKVKAMIAKSDPAIFVPVVGKDNASAPEQPATPEQPLAESYTRPLASKDVPDIFPAKEYQSPAEIEAKYDYQRQLFRDPRYKTSALYRHEVAQKLAEMTKNDAKLEGHRQGDTAQVSLSP